MAWALQPSPVLIARNGGARRHRSIFLHVASRAGCDLNPLDPANGDDGKRLLSYIWADQQDRLERTLFCTPPLPPPTARRSIVPMRWTGWKSA